jgi:hypothetical protein
MHRETPIRRSLLQSGLPRAAENSNRYTVRIEFPVSCRKQTTGPHSNRYTNRASFANLCKINRSTKIIESPVSYSRQRIAHQINRNISRARLARLASPTPQTLNPTPYPINRHTFLLEFRVSHRKESNLKILIATETCVFPQGPPDAGGPICHFEMLAMRP